MKTRNLLVAIALTVAFVAAGFKVAQAQAFSDESHVQSIKLVKNGDWDRRDKHDWDSNKKRHEHYRGYYYYPGRYHYYGRGYYGRYPSRYYGRGYYGRYPYRYYGRGYYGREYYGRYPQGYYGRYPSRYYYPYGREYYRGRY